MVLSTVGFNVFAEDTTETVVDSTYVAQVGDEKFESVLSAITYALENKAPELKLLADSREVMTSDYDFIIDADLTITADAPVTAAFYNDGTKRDFAVGANGDYTLTIGENVTFDLEDRVIWLGYFDENCTVVVDGTLTCANLWVGTKTVVNSTGKLISDTHEFVMRKDANLVVNGGTVEASYFQLYTGHIEATNDAKIISHGPVNVNGAHNYSGEGDFSISLDNSTFESDGAFNIVAAESWTDGVEITLVNGSSINTDAAFGTTGEVNVSVDATSSVTDVNGTAVAPLVEVTTYEELVAALAEDKSNVVMMNDIKATATQSSSYGVAGVVVGAGDILDGDGHKLTINGANGTWDCAIAITGGTVKNLTVAGAFRGIFMPGADGDVVIDNCKIDNVCYPFNSDAGSKEYGVTIKNTVLNGWTSFSDVHKFVTFESCTFGKGTGGYQYEYCRPYQETTFTGCEFNEGFVFDASATGDNTLEFNECTYNGEELSTGAGVEMFPDGGSIKIDDEESKLVADPVASVGLSTFATLEEAFAAAVDGDTITLLVDATPTLTSQRAITKASVIDLNGKTLTLTEDDLYFGTTTFKNGNIVVEPSVVASTAVFWMFENQTLTFDNVDITATGVTGTYLMGINAGTGSAINILNGTNIIIDNDAIAHLTAVICDNGTDNNITIKGSNIDVNNIEGRFYLGGSNGNVSVENSIIDLDGVKEGFYLRAGQELDIAGTSNVDVKLNDTNGRYGINLTDATANYTVDDTATVNASIYKAPATDGSNLAKKVKLSFEATDKKEVYNIYAEAVDGTINRLSAVQVKFALDNSRMSYTLAPASELGVTLTNDLDDEEAYVFNFNGETAADATGAKLLIGTVTFGGYGNFNFTVDASFNNKIKTAQTTDNIVEEYVPTPDAANEKQGTFDIASSAITGAEVVEAKRDVKVVIDFNNDITAGNDADYNDMTVTLTGSNGEVHTAQVGDLVNGQPNYTAEKAEMTFNVTAGYRYTVVVKGEGYRTARYSTNVDASDDALVLTFWNNAKADENNNPVLAYIEDGEARSLKDVTFLAGDIAQDNIIDKYDLAAVVSYFGFDNLKTTNPNYVKYDLNRDGKIDADDISYVLVSWGK